MNYIMMSQLKATGLNTILTKVIKLLINDVSSHLTELFNLLFPAAFSYQY